MCGYARVRLGKLKQYFHNYNDVCTVQFVHVQRTCFMILHELLLCLIRRTNMFVRAYMMLSRLKI